MKLYCIISFALAFILYFTLQVLAMLFGGDTTVPIWGVIASAAIMLNHIIASIALIYKTIKL